MELLLRRHRKSLFVELTVTLVVLQHQVVRIVRRRVVNLLVTNRDDLDDGTAFDG